VGSQRSPASLVKRESRTQLVMSKAVFLDRDGVLNFDQGYTYKIEDLELLPGVGDSLKKLKDAGYKLVVITNQSGVARGLYTLNEVHIFHDALQKLLESKYDVRIDDFYICPHHVDGTVSELSIECQCRKPGTELPLQAVEKYSIDITKSYFVGDKNSDMECAKNLSVVGIQVVDKDSAKSPYASHVVSSLEEALQYII